MISRRAGHREVLCPVVFLGGPVRGSRRPKASGAAVHSAASVLATPDSSLPMPDSSYFRVARLSLACWSDATVAGFHPLITPAGKVVHGVFLPHVPRWRVGSLSGGVECVHCSHDTSRIAWAKLMARVGEEFPLVCPACGGDIRLIAFITRRCRRRPSRAPTCAACAARSIAR